MILAVSVVIAVVFGAGVFLILQRDLLRVVVGIVLISNAAILFIVAAGLSRGEPPIYPVPRDALDAGVSDPLVQAMALTAIVISLSTAALLLAIVYRLYAAHGTVDVEDISAAETREAEELEREGSPEREEEPADEPGEVETKERTR